jgi:hypothetical protein
MGHHIIVPQDISFPRRPVPPTLETTITMGDLMDLRAISSEMVRKVILDRIMDRAIGEFDAQDHPMPPLPDQRGTIIEVLVNHRKPQSGQLGIAVLDSNKLWRVTYVNPGLGTLTHETVHTDQIRDWRPYPMIVPELINPPQVTSHRNPVEDIVHGVEADQA